MTLFPLWSQAQSSMQEALDEIELNNSFLKSMRDEAEAERLANKTNVNLPDPEIGFTHNWYTKGSNLRVKEFSVTQELDWAVITGQRKRISRKKNELVELQYVQDRNGVRLRALQELISLVHATSWLKELKSRENDAATLAEAYQKMLESGKTNVIEANRARLNLVRVANDVKRAETDRQELLNRLKALNGGMELAHVVTEYGNNELPLDFEGWCAEAENVNPELDYESKTTYAGEFESMRSMFLMLGGVLSFIVGLVGVLNFFNAILTGIIARRRELAVLQAVGMTGRQLRAMLACEGLLYALGAAGLALLLTVVLGTYHLELTPFLLVIPLFTLLGVGTPILTSRASEKHTVVERLWTE